MTYNIVPPKDIKTELFDPVNPMAVSNDARLTYRGGPLLANVEIVSIFLGDQWNAAAVSMQEVNDYLSYIVTSNVIKNLTEYSTHHYVIAGGSFAGTYHAADYAFLASSLSDESIRAALNEYIQDKKIPQPTANTLYMVYVQSGITITSSDGSESCQQWCGYHDSQGQIYYGVIAYPDCDGCLGGMTPFEAITAVSTHEICEAITDPVPGTGWYDDNNGEIGDICAWQEAESGNYVIQTEWSNRANSCV